ncbi:MAG: hypothetical protein IID32_10555 [Planctomycetes bacterium]|nr:hypothetical protein [Planctomycetota bacterium]
MDTEGILFITRDQVVFVDPVTGKIIWKYEGYTCRIPIPFPTSLGDGRIFITGGYGAGSVMIRVSKNGDTFEIEELFRLKDHGSQIHPTLYYDGHLYANFNTNENMRAKKPDGLVCYDLSGNVKWTTEDNPDINRGSLMIADGMMYIMDGINGDLILAKVNPHKYEPLARAKIFKGGKKSNIWSPMALSDGLLIVRDQHQMKCLYVGQ